MVSDERCDVYSIVGNDVGHFLVGCGEFERDRLVLLDDVYRIVGAREWLGEFWESGQGGKGEIAIGKRGGGHI